MNQRIKELALLANPASREIYESSNWKYNCAAWSAQDVGKFAELIVRECARQVNCYDALNIFEHFGVEE